ncbi:MAG: endonuclease III [Pirellulaceae bacterium]
MTDQAGKRQAARAVRGLHRCYPDATCALQYESPFQLLIATVLSAQCTDKRVNLVAKKLFTQYPTAVEMAAVHQKTLEKVIQSTGFFRNKAKNIKALSRELLDRHDGTVPQEMEQLVLLPGVGRKTANVVLGTAFGLATGVVVDTHVRRISRRLGLTEHRDPVKIERDLMRVLPRKEWIRYSHSMIQHGRQICKARKPWCEECAFDKFCPRLGVESIAVRGD